MKRVSDGIRATYGSNFEAALLYQRKLEAEKAKSSTNVCEKLDASEKVLETQKSQEVISPSKIITEREEELISDNWVHRLSEVLVTATISIL